jgi:hypothetical protein
MLAIGRDANAASRVLDDQSRRSSQRRNRVDIAPSHTLYKVEIISVGGKVKRSEKGLFGRWNQLQHALCCDLPDPQTAPPCLSQRGYFSWRPTCRLHGKLIASTV